MDSVMDTSFSDTEKIIEIGYINWLYNELS